MTMNELPDRREQVSALADGQLHGAEFAAVMDALAQEDDARTSWHVYHLVGDVLRSPDLAECGRDEAFLARLNERLRVEAVPSRVTHPVGALLAAGDRSASEAARSAANGGVFRWKITAGVASLVAVAVLGWHLVAPTPSDGTQWARRAPETGPARALVTAPEDAADVASQVPVMIRDPRLDELLAAHRQFGGASALQSPSGFLRSATFVEPER